VAGIPPFSGTTVGGPVVKDIGVELIVIEAAASVGLD
jgi:hypothetical protein